MITLAITGAVILFLSNFYKTWKRSKLSQIDLLEYIKAVQPQVTKYTLIANIPIVFVVIFVLIGLTVLAPYKSDTV